ncbi:ubiquitin-like protein Pup [Actinomyces sp. W5033]|uniref:ubiquitin-like protein Pup n=1 Tax=Actinomyces sp. W5033 TaxID=3446479 RepID=UPI003EE35946
MSLNEQIQPTGGPTEDAADPSPAVGGQVQVTGVDDILDEIDAVLETNAAAFVQGFVQKGGE